jgi:putative transposase
LRLSKSEDDREGEFHSQVFERYNRYEPEVAEALTQMFGSRDKHAISVGEVAATLMGLHLVPVR